MGEDGNRVLGLQLNMHGIVFWFVVDATGVGGTLSANAAWYRPWVIDITGPRRTSRVVAAWAARAHELRYVELKVQPLQGGERMGVSE